MMWCKFSTVSLDRTRTKASGQDEKGHIFDGQYKISRILDEIIQLGRESLAHFLDAHLTVTRDQRPFSKLLFLVH